MACCNIFQRPGKKIPSEWQHRTANLISSSLTGLQHFSLSLLPFSIPQCLSVASSLSYSSPLPCSTLLSPSHHLHPSTSLHFYHSRFSLRHPSHHVSCHLLRADSKSKADKGDRSSDTEGITRVYEGEIVEDQHLHTDCNGCAGIQH